MKSVKEILIGAMTYFRQQLISDTPAQGNTTHALSLAGAYDLQDQINTLNSNKVDKVSGKYLVTVDSTLSSTSTNPVQNKVINSALSNYVKTYYTSIIVRDLSLTSKQWTMTKLSRTSGEPSNSTRLFMRPEIVSLSNPDVTKDYFAVIPCGAIYAHIYNGWGQTLTGSMQIAAYYTIPS